MRLGRFIPFSLLLNAGPCQAVLEERQAVTSSVAPNPSPTSSVFVPPTGSPAPTVNSSAYDLTQHFCRIYRHASVYADGKIYIDGGNAYIPKGSTTFSNTSASGWTAGMNDNLLVLDLSQNFTNQDTFPYSALHKGPDVPSSLIEHALWYSSATRKIYQLGGWFSSNNPQDPGYVNTSAIPEAAIWEFDIDTQVWSVADDLGTVNTGSKVDRPGAAANCDAPSLNMSFIFEGYVQMRSDKDHTSYKQNFEFKFLEGMLALDTSNDVSKPTLTNISVPQQMNGADFGPRMNGAMVHVPVGNRGIIVQIGGQIPTKSTPYGVPIQDANAGNVNIPLSYVDIYDIETGYWFRQETFGLTDGMPYGRSDICTIMVPAKDNSSFNIYMVAGIDDYSKATAVEEIWVLTLPTFQWTLVHSRTDAMYGHTCHAVGENLVIVGGMQTNPEGGNVQTCAPHMPAEIFSLVTQNYTGQFDAEGAKRPAPVPSQVVAAIGGTTDGGAYITAPKVWSDLYLQYIFNPSLTRPTYTPAYILANGTGTGNSTGVPPAPAATHTGKNKAVIGGAVGGSLGAALLIAILIGLYLHRRKAHLHATEAARQSQVTATSELPAPAYSPGLHKDAYYTHTQHADAEMPTSTYQQTEPAELYGHHEHGHGYPPDTPEIDNATISTSPPLTSRFSHRHTISDVSAPRSTPSPGTANTRDWTISPSSHQGGFDTDSPTFRHMMVSGTESTSGRLNE